MAITLNQIGGLLARFGNEIVNEQANFACPFVGNGHIQKIKHAHEQGIVRIRDSDGLQSTGQLADGSALPDGANVSFLSGSYLPKIFFTRLSIPRGAAHLAAGGRDGVRLVREELEVAGRQLGKVLGQAVFRAPIGQLIRENPANNVASATGTVVVGAPGDQDFLITSIAGLYVGQFVMLTDSGGNEQLASVTAINYNMDENAAGTALTYVDGPSAGFGVFGITLNVPAATYNVGGVTDNAVAGASTPVELPNRNTEAAPASGLQPADPMVSLGDAYGGAALYGIANDAYTGNTKAVNGALTASSMRAMSTTIKRRAGYGWHMLVMNSNQLQNYFETTIAPTAALNYLPGSTTKDADGGATVPMFQGMPIVVDENVPDHVMYFFNKDDVKLAEFKAFGPDNDGGADHGMVDRSKLIYDTQIWGMYNMRVQRRNSGGQLTGLQQNT